MKNIKLGLLITHACQNSIQSRMLIEKSGRNPTENQHDEAFISQDPTG
jgi:hypothetical protein